MMGDKYHYEPGAIHNDHHKEIHIGSVSERAFGELVRNFFREEAEVTDYVEVKEPAAAQKGSRRGRPRKSGNQILKSFIYDAGSEAETNKRLQFLYNGLRQLKWISADTKPKIFLRLFSEEETSSRVVWTGEINTLAELFRELVVRRKYVMLPDGVSIWVLVNARFWEKEGNQEFGNDRLSATRTPIDNKESIDFLVEILNPNIDIDDLIEQAKMSQG